MPKRLCSFLLSSTAIFLCCISLSYGVANAISVSENKIDRLALLAFKSQLTPESALSSWNDSNHLCDWEGVTCGRKHQRVRILDLRSKGLTGPISPDIGNLSFLKEVYLSNNSFVGEIPPEFGKLFRLVKALLNANSFAGEIPVNITLCSNLRELFLSKNDLVGNIPVEFGSLSRLVKLAVESNKLTGGIPSSFGNLTSLEALGLSGNRLRGRIPSTLHQLKRLQIFSTNFNQFSGSFPSSLCNLSSLEVISITDNHITGNLPSDFGLMLPSLQHLYLGGNHFSGNIPKSLFNASKLQTFSIEENHFTGKVPFNIGNLRDLQYLALQHNDLGSGKAKDLDFFTPLTHCRNLQKIVLLDNKFGGRIPPSVGNFSSNLNSLYLSKNQISGNIPAEIENLQHLYVLDLGFNKFTGSIPLGIEKLDKLQVLFLGFNQLSGEVPSFTRNMSQLYFLSLQNNFLKGNISSILENQVMKILRLSSNNFSGPIPKEIGLSTGLTELNLTLNFLDGSIPLEMGNLKNLFYFTVSRNKMSGDIPSTLGSCSSLEHLYLEDNSFQGTLPLSFSSLKGLRDLDVSMNNLSGSIPKELGMLKVLVSLNLSFNSFEGELPIEGVFRKPTEFSVLGNHKICGGIPKLGLAKCRIQIPRKHKVHLALKVTLGVVIPLFVVGLFVAFCFMTKRKVTSQSEQHLVDIKRVSYNDLNKATEGFSLSNLIGQGSYGSVYKGILHEGKSLIAVKVLNLGEKGASKAFIAECEALRTIRHRNLLKILTVCSSVDFNGNDFRALVFDLMTNGSLDDWLHAVIDGEDVPRSLSLHQRLNIAIDVASALDYLHNNYDQPIVHCDVKPSNVLLSEDFIAHVGDFGLAKFLSKATSMTNSSHEVTGSIAVKGTIGYIPPEYALSSDVSTRGDVYSYGILLLEMFTGKRPTDQMFKDGLSLHGFCKRDLPEGVMEITDMHLLSEETPNNEGLTSMKWLKKCLTSIIRIGVACSMDMMTERMDIKDVLNELVSIKKSMTVIKENM